MLNNSVNNYGVSPAIVSQLSAAKNTKTSSRKPRDPVFLGEVDWVDGDDQPGIGISPDDFFYGK